MKSFLTCPSPLTSLWLILYSLESWPILDVLLLSSLLSSVPDRILHDGSFFFFNLTSHVWNLMYLVFSPVYSLCDYKVPKQKDTALIFLYLCSLQLWYYLVQIYLNFLLQLLEEQKNPSDACWS